jgi:hypothetical protein
MLSNQTERLNAMMDLTLIDCNLIHLGFSANGGEAYASDPDALLHCGCDGQFEVMHSNGYLTIRAV